MDILLAETEAYLWYVEPGKLPLWVLLTWLFVLGSVLGSFFNVVVYRLPRRMSLSHPPSRCGSCEHPIRPRDNIPILGWLLLGGRCRDCKAPISARYPLVECFCAMLFASLAYVELVYNPGRNPWGLYAYHLLLLSTLLCAGLVEYDGQTRLLPLLLPVLAASLLLPLLFGDLRPFAYAPMFAKESGDPLRPKLLGIVSSLFGGLIVGGLVWPATRLPKSTAHSDAIVTALAIVGVTLGTAALSMIALVTGGLYVLTLLLAQRLPWLRSAGYLFWLSLVTTTCVFWLATTHAHISRIGGGTQAEFLAALQQFVQWGSGVAALSMLTYIVQARRGAVL